MDYARIRWSSNVVLGQSKVVGVGVGDVVAGGFPWAACH